MVKGYTQYPLEGVSFAGIFADLNAETGKQTQFYSIGGTQAIWHRGWKAASVTPSALDMWADYAKLRWEMFDTDADPTECHDLDSQHRVKLKELIALWWTQAGQYGALPLENRRALEILTTERPQLAKNRNRYVSYPGCAEVPESVAPNIRNRSATIDCPDAAGVLLAQGSGNPFPNWPQKPGPPSHATDAEGRRRTITQRAAKARCS